MVDGQAGPCMGRCMGGDDVMGVVVNDVLYYLGVGVGGEEDW